MQRRILVVAALAGALAGVVALILLLRTRAPELEYVETEAPPQHVPAPPADDLQPYKGGGTLKGRVIHGQTRKPIAGAIVRALKPYLKYEEGEELPLWGNLMSVKEVVTGLDGLFALEDLPPDYWNLWVERKGFSFTTVPRARFDEDHTIVLWPSCVIHGRVVLPDGQPAAGVRIEYTPQGTHSEVFARYKLEDYYTETDEAGRFRYVDIPHGKFTVEVYPEDYLPAPWTAQQPLKPGEVRDLGTHKLDGGFGMEVRVLWQGTEEPVPGIEVVVRPLTDPMPRTKTGQRRRTDSEGVARFHGLGGQVVEKPLFTVVANVDGIGPVLPDARGPFPPDSSLIVHLRKDGVVKGEAVGPAGEPLKHFFASLEPVGHMTRQLLVTGQRGKFVIYGVPEGSYRLHIRHHDLVDAETEVEAVGGSEVDAGVIHLQPGAEVYGQVRRSDGRPLEGVVRVNLARRTRNRAGQDVYDLVGQTNARSDGTYSIRGIPAGRYAIRAESFRDPSPVTDPDEVEIRPGTGGVEKNLVIYAYGHLRLKFMDLVENQVRQVVPPRTILVAEATGRESLWGGDGTALRLGNYTVYVELQDVDGVSKRYRALDVRVQAESNPDPIEIRLYEIREQ